MMPLTGWLPGRFGMKHIFLASIIGLTIASALCGAATSLGELVAFRALQGVAGVASTAVASHPVADQPTGAARARDGGVRRRHVQ